MNRFTASLNEKVTKDCKDFIEIELKQFVADSTRTYLSFSSSLSKAERAFVHKKCQAIGLKTKSVGKEPHRILTISKNFSTIDAATLLNLSEEAEETLNEIVNVNEDYIYPNKDLDTPNLHKLPAIESEFGRLNYGNLVLVPPIQQNNLVEFRKTLPSWNCRNDFLNFLDNYQIVMVTSETGSGKTTQFPQFILEDFCDKNQPCRILCCQPRRISAVSVAERVAKERGEKLGQTVGFQIKLESNLGPHTALIYCTNGVLLRTFMKGYSSLENITHIILDEIHERDKFSDFLMICLKECLQNFPNLKLILMSATMNVASFKLYFPTACIVTVPGKMFPVKRHYLPDVLQAIDYELYGPKGDEDGAVGTQLTANTKISSEYDDALKLEMIAAINQCVETGSDESFDHLMHLILSESAWIDQQTPNGCTALIAAAGFGKVDLVEQLLCMGADPSLKTCEGLSAADWAAYYNKWDVLDLFVLSDYNKIKPVTNFGYSSELLDACDKILSREAIDSNLVARTVFYIHENDPKGSILVFLPGYEDILNCHDAIVQNSKFIDKNFEIFMLHSSMPIKNQIRVFNTIPNKQKVILSTNIAETSITIDDVVYVVDSGKMKEKTYDAISGISSLQTFWISKSNADQRRGRAGRIRPGEYFCLYSMEMYESFLPHRIPEIVRVPLHELCLLTKMLSSQDIPIAEFLDKAMDKPSRRSVESSIASLISLGALDRDENLTVLGAHILQLSVEPHLGKMLIYSLIFKCLDPILTIVAGLTYKDPFILPLDPSKKDACLKKRHEFAGKSQSDHMILLKIFQEWLKAKSSGKERKFCRENFISQASMEIIAGNRMHLLKQMRGSRFISTHPPEVMKILNSHSDSWPIIKAVLSAGLFPNVAYINGNNISTKTEKKVFIHTTSCLKRFKMTGNKEADGLWILYEELFKMRLQSSIKFGTVVTPLMIALLCGQKTATENYEMSSTTITLDEWLTFEITNVNVLKLRKLIENLIFKGIDNPLYVMTTRENALLKGLLDVLTIEDTKYGLSKLKDVDISQKSGLCDTSYGFNPSKRFTPMKFTGGAVPRTTAPRNVFQNQQPHQLLQSFSNYQYQPSQSHNFPMQQSTYKYQSQPLKKQSQQYQSNKLPVQQNQQNDRQQPSKQYQQLEQQHCSYRQLERQHHQEQVPNKDNAVDGLASAFNFNTYITTPYLPLNSMIQKDPKQNKSVEIFRRALLDLENDPQNNYKNGSTKQENSEKQNGNSNSSYVSQTNRSNVIPKMVDLNNIPLQSIFFVVRPKTMKSIEISQTHATWLFSPFTERKILNLPNKDVNVILFFSVQRSHAFQGVARLITTNRIIRKSPHKVKWLSMVSVPYDITESLKNALNNNKSVNTGEDGQEIDFATGLKMCKLFLEQPPLSQKNIRAIRGCKY